LSQVPEEEHKADT